MCKERKRCVRKGEERKICVRKGEERKGKEKQLGSRLVVGESDGLNPSCEEVPRV
jgi:hypothetical protein